MGSKIFWLKTFCFIILGASGLFVFRFISTTKAQSICPFPVKGNYNLTNSCYTTSTTGIEEGRLNITTPNLNINPNTNFIYNPGYGIDLGSGMINFQSSSTTGNIKKGYLCVQDNDNDGCWLNPTFSTSSTCSATNLKRYSNFVTTFPTNYWGDCNDNSNQQCYLLNELCGDDIDNNCNGLIDEGCYYGCLGMGDNSGQFFNFSAVVYNNKIYYLGGREFVEYNPTTDSWTILSFPSALIASISGHSAVVYQDKMYVFGGTLSYPSNPDSHNLSNDLFEYNFSTKQWRYIQPQQNWYNLPAPRQEHKAAVYQGKMYVFGGDVVPYTSHELWEYDFQSNTWTLKRNMAEDISYTDGWIGRSFVMVLDENRGKLYFNGGNTESIIRSPPNRIYSYSFTDNRFYIEATLNNYVYDEQIRYSSAVMYQDKMYIFGGMHFSSNNNTAIISNKLIAFDPITKNWEEKTPDTIARYQHEAVVVGQKMYVFSGTIFNAVNATNQILHDLRIYDFNSNTWSKGSFGPISRYNHSAVVYNNKMYVYGGLCGPHAFTRSDMKSFDFQTQSWAYELSAPFSKNLHSAIVYNNKMYLLGNNSITWREQYPSGLPNDPFMFVYDFLNKTWSQYQATGSFLPNTQGTGGENQYAYISNNKMYKVGEYSYQIGGLPLSNHGRLVECTLETPSCQVYYTGSTSDIITTRERGYSTTFFNNTRYIYGGIGTSVGCNVNTRICDDRAYHSAVLEGNQLYIFGGYEIIAGIFSDMLIPLSSLKKLDMVTGTWTTLASDSIPRYAHSAVIYQNKMYIVGGKTTNDVPLGDARIYNINSNTWQTGIPEPQR